MFEKWWPGTESNRRRQPFQGLQINHLQTVVLKTQDLRDEDLDSIWTPVAIFWSLDSTRTPQSTGRCGLEYHLLSRTRAVVSGTLCRLAMVETNSPFLYRMATMTTTRWERGTGVRKSAGDSSRARCGVLLRAPDPRAATF